MGEFEVTGPDRNAFVNRVTCNDVGALAAARSSTRRSSRAEGTFVDDCTVYRFDDKVMIVVNAVEHREGLGPHREPQKGGANVRLKNISDDVGLLALQGPRAEAVLAAAHRHAARPTRLLQVHHRQGGRRAAASSAAPATPARTASSSTAAPGHRGASGDALEGRGRRPADRARRPRLAAARGGATRSTATTSTTPSRRSRPGWLDRQARQGRAVHRAATRSGPRRSAASRGASSASSSSSAGIPRHGYPVYFDGQQVDIVRSGTMSPSLGIPIGTTYLPAAAAKRGYPVRGGFARHPHSRRGGQPAVLHRQARTEGEVGAHWPRGPALQPTMRIAILTVSDAGQPRGARRRLGRRYRGLGRERGHAVAARALVPDETGAIAGALARGPTPTPPTSSSPPAAPASPRATSPPRPPAPCWSAKRPASPRPPGERCSAVSPRGALRGLAGVRGRTLIVNLPGSPGGVRDGLAVLDASGARRGPVRGTTPRTRTRRADGR